MKRQLCAAQRGHFGFIVIDADDVIARFGQTAARDQAHIA